MSGFAGIVRLDGENRSGADERKRIEKMAQQLPAYEEAGPRVWSQGDASFCFTLLKTGPAPQSDVQPVTVDQRTWLIGDVRLDGRQDLIARLGTLGEDCGFASTDEELVLRAWRQWGCGSRDTFLGILNGDFSFALWEPAERRLTCFRDLMGSRSFFYARSGSLFYFGNTLQAVRQWPLVSDEFDYHYFGDYLLNGWCLDPWRTAYTHIKRLAPGNSITASRDNFRIERFSRLPIEEPFHRKKDSEYIEEYRVLLTQAVRERLPQEGAVVFMSGGLDSTTVAATAVRIAAKSGSTETIYACTADYQPLFDDRESEWAAVAASHIGIDLKVVHGGEYIPFGDTKVLGSLPEPKHEPYLGFVFEQYRAAAHHARVALTGHGGDDILSANALPYLSRLIRNFRFAEAAHAFGSYFLRTGKVPPIRAGIRTRLRRWFMPANAVEQYPYPVWLSSKFEREYGLRERWEELRRKSKPEHPVHPEGYASLCASLWPSTLEGDEATRGGARIETRAPLLDTRLIRFLLRVPPVPWCSDKHLVRAVSKGLLPESLRKRPKSPLPRDPVQVAMAQQKWMPGPVNPLTSALREMVDAEKWAATLKNAESSAEWINHYPLSLELWLKGNVEKCKRMQ